MKLKEDEKSKKIKRYENVNKDVKKNDRDCVRGKKESQREGTRE